MLDSAYHVFHRNDLKEHYLECVYPVDGMPYCPCKCKPRFEQVGDSIVIVHSSFDGREGVEIVNEILRNG